MIASRPQDSNLEVQHRVLSITMSPILRFHMDTNMQFDCAACEFESRHVLG